MSHTYIIGTTESGKSSLGKLISAKTRASAIDVLVLDPLGDPGWSASFQTRDPDAFLIEAKKRRRCALIVDESSEAIDKYDKEKEWVTTRSRHWGHKAYLIAQRVPQLNVTARGQCSQAFIFWVGPDDAKALSQEWKGLTADMISNLRKLEFLRVARFDPPQKWRLTFDKRGRCSIIPG